MKKDLTIYYLQHSVTVSPIDAIELLEKQPFGVFLSFVDPRTNTLIDKLFPLFYKPSHTFGLKGRCFITEWKGLGLYLPADLCWWAEIQSGENVRDRVLRQTVSYLAGGVFVNKDIRIEVLPNFRIGGYYDFAFRQLMQTAGYPGLVEFCFAVSHICSGNAHSKKNDILLLSARTEEEAIARCLQLRPGATITAVSYGVDEVSALLKTVRLPGSTQTILGMSQA